ncbi:Putative ATP-binding cassette (ABC) transporter protein [Madurella fahalii]|uniref:ATP-binding cassette (ABC) transporter protein n=1 Tax=Madurella fahalii TaxID=1157608 RepID=A0ABQ0G059_9PEZI
MSDPELLHKLFGGAAALLVALLTAPALVYALGTATPRWRRRGYAHLGQNSYEDHDGIATEESIRAYSDTRPRVAVCLGAIIGLAASVAARIVTLRTAQDTPRLSEELVHWTEPTCWVLVCLQCACLPARHQHQAKFRLTIVGLVSSLLIAVSVALRYGYEALASVARPERDTVAVVLGSLYLAQFFSAVATAAAFAAFPRRPDVYDKTGLVDQQHTLSLLSLFSYSWDRVIFDVARERQMEIEDIPNLDSATRSRNLETRFLDRLSEGPLWWQLIKGHAAELSLQWGLTLVIAFLSLFPQVVLYNFLSRIEQRQGHTSADPTVFIWVLGLLLSQLLQVGFSNWLRWITTTRLEIPVGSLLQSLVFSKALKQYETAPPGQKVEKSDGSSGQGNPKDGKAKKDTEPETRQSVINHMKLDSGRVTIFCLYNNNFPMAIFKLILAGGFSVSLMGWLPVLCGLAAGSLVIPLSSLLSKRYTSLHFGLMKYRDGKAHLLTEALQGMRQIRYSALEQHWESKILASRDEELRQYWKVALWQCLVVFVVNLSPVLLASVTFFIYVWQNGTHIRASVIFTSLGLFDQLYEAVALLPLLQMYLLEAWTSAVRLEKYFKQSDKEPVSEPGDAIAFENATVAWPRIEDSEAPEGGTQEQRGAHSMLRDVNLEFPIGKLSVITGKTGSGKSLLLAALLGEVKLLAGTVRMPTPPTFDENAEHIPDEEWIIPQLTAFVSQTPWIESGTVRENIVFGLPFVEDRYRKVLAACALEKDIELLVDGDETEVGPKGVTLSGGQRWRTALARALYSRAGILVLDDVLSAVDAHVGRLIVDKALSGELARGRTRILATHHAELVMPHASYLVRLRSGEVESAEILSPVDLDPELEAAATSPDETSSYAQNGHAVPVGQKKAKKASQDEEQRETGRVKWKVYKAYYKASGGALPWLVGIAVLFLGHFLTIARTWSLKELAQQAASETVHFASQTVQMITSPNYADVVGFPKTSKVERGIYFWLGAFLVIDFSMLIVQLIRVMIFFIVGLTASKVLFQRMTHAILRAPLRWIDTVPAGRILNRFTSDTFTVDRRLSTQTFTFLRTVLFLVVIIGTSLSVSVYVIFFGLFLLIFYVRIAQEYINAAREVKRINSVAHSPIYDQFSSVLSGLSTIRAFGRTKFYMERMYGLIDNSAKASWALQLSSRWMAFRMGVLGALFVTIVANAVAFSRVDAALAGFSLAFALRYTNALTSLLQAMTSVELGFNACERVLEYAEIETEPEDGKDAPAAWPTEGRIEVDNLTVRYAEDLPPVLKNVTFTVGAGERIGIVGRTGAGKSTLAAVFFRLLDPVEGTVHIDNVDIASLKLTQLRSRLAIIPQDPFLFSGTLRSNLDMEGLLDDYELLSALQRVHLIEAAEDPNRPSVYPPAELTVASTSSSAIVPALDSATATETSTPAEPDQPTLAASDLGSQSATNNTNIFTNLSTPISTGGANLSQGQRQLVCLARALLKRPKIVVLDEATSAVDRGTDSNIQESLRKEFAAAGCTVLVIAHRLSTVADFDRLLVLDKGRVAEVGSPRELLERGMRRAAAGEKKVATPANATSDAGVLGEGRERESDESTLQSEEGGEGETDGTGGFWELVQKSAEKEKLMEMILGEEKEAVVQSIFGVQA